MNKDIMKRLFPKEIENVERGNCAFCNKPINVRDFKDSLSKREFEISGLCQACQDETFSE